MDKHKEVKALTSIIEQAASINEWAIAQSAMDKLNKLVSNK